jgi:hypothetical protein
VEIGAIIALWAETVFGEFFALALVAEVECVRELAGVAFLAEPALVVFADEVPDA